MAVQSEQQGLPVDSAPAVAAPESPTTVVSVDGGAPSAPLSRLAGNFKASLTWQNVEYTVTLPKKEGTKKILHGIDGCVKSGEMMCILGPSGGGKTSLINILTGRLRHAGVHDIGRTSIKCNGETIKPSQVHRIIGYVTQDDFFEPMLTVLETLNFAARLKLRKASATMRRERVEEVISALGLQRCKNTRIGDDARPDLKGISGGERRRLAIAAELLNPDITVLFLDEPTSGLDAASAFSVCKLLSDLATKAGMAVACTLHQPRGSIMEMFTSVHLLGLGRTIYWGPYNQVVPYFRENGKEAPQHESPSDWLLDLLAAPQASGEEGERMLKETEQMCVDMSAQYSKGELNKMCQTRITDALNDEEARQNLAQRVKELAGRKHPTSWLNQFFTLTWRIGLVKLRDPIAAVTQLSSSVIVGLLFGGLYFQTSDKPQAAAVPDTMTAVAMITVMIAFLPFDVILTFPLERRRFLREQNAGLYTTSAFYLARILAEVPTHTLTAVILAAITHSMVGLKMSVVLWMLMCVIAMWVGAGLMTLIGSVSASFEQANLLATVVLVLFMMANRAFIRQMPGWLGWLPKVSFISHVVDLATYWEFANYTCTITADEPCAMGIDGASVISVLELKLTKEEDAVLTLLYLIIMIIVYRFLTFLAVKFAHTGRTIKENLIL